jgi:hypothetical protein
MKATTMTQPGAPLLALGANRIGVIPHVPQGHRRTTNLQISGRLIAGGIAMNFFTLFEGALVAPAPN